MKNDVKPRQTKRWREPRWSYDPRLKAELSRFIELKTCVRAFVVVVLLTVLLAYSLRRAVPDLEFDWVGALALSVLAFVIMMGLIGGLLWMIPPIDVVTPKGIARYHGQSVQWRLRADIRRIIVETSDVIRPLLRVESARKPFEAGIASQVALPELAESLREIFPELIVVEMR